MVTGTTCSLEIYHGDEEELVSRYILEIDDHGGITDEQYDSLYEDIEAIEMKYGILDWYGDDTDLIGYQSYEISPDEVWLALAELQAAVEKQGVTVTKPWAALYTGMSRKERGDWGYV